MLGSEALKLFCKKAKGSVLNLGDKKDSGATQIMKDHSLAVTTINLTPPADIVEDYMQVEFQGYHNIWCSHVLEHQRNPGLFLDKVHSDLKEEGVLALTVPPPSVDLKGGHVTVWNGTVLLYQLILSGFDCREAELWRYGYNISVVVQKRSISLEGLTGSKADLPVIRSYMPSARSK